MPSSTFTWTEEFNGSGPVLPSNSLFTQGNQLNGGESSVGALGHIPFVMSGGSARLERIRDAEFLQEDDGVWVTEFYTSMYIDHAPKTEIITTRIQDAYSSLIGIDVGEGDGIDLPRVVQGLAVLLEDLLTWDSYGLGVLSSTARENSLPDLTSPSDAIDFLNGMVVRLRELNPGQDDLNIIVALGFIVSLAIATCGTKLLNLECTWGVDPSVGRTQARPSVFQTASSPLFNMYLHWPEGINLGFPTLVYGDPPNYTVNGVPPNYVSLGKVSAGSVYNVRFACSENLLYINGVARCPLTYESNWGASSEGALYPTSGLSDSVLHLAADEIRNYVTLNDMAEMHSVVYDRFSATVEMWYPKVALGVLKVLTEQGWRRA